MSAVHPRPEPLLLPHESIFGAFLAVTWARFALVLGVWSSEALLYLAMIAVDAWLVAFCRASPTDRRWRARLIFHPIALNVVFAHMKGAIPKIAPERMDAALQRIDAALVGGNLSLRMEPLVHSVLTEALSSCYILFFPYLLFSLIWYFRQDLGTLKAFVVGMFTVYGLGFLGYTLVPAWGPWIAMAREFRVVLDGGPITRWNDAIVRWGTNGVDVFPSLHCALSSYFLFFDRRHTRWRFLVYVVPCVGLWVSTLYLRYHYFVDVLAGFSLSAFALWISARFERREKA
jgi:membrane-associated phospholipid phosphatase